MEAWQLEVLVSLVLAVATMTDRDPGLICVYRPMPTEIDDHNADKVKAACDAWLDRWSDAIPRNDTATWWELYLTLKDMHPANMAQLLAAALVKLDKR